MRAFDSTPMPKTERITKLVADLFAKMPEIEAARAELITESFKSTEGLPIVTRKALAFRHILQGLPIVIRPGELIVGSTTLAPRGCQTYPEFSYDWLEAEFDTVEHRTADPFYISEETKQRLKKVNPYWKGKTTSELARSYMAPETLRAMDHNFFTPGNYYYNGVGHVNVHYDRVIYEGLEGIMAQTAEELAKVKFCDPNYGDKKRFLEAVIISCQAVIDYAHRYSDLAKELADKESDPRRKQELIKISETCSHVPEHP
ncbi:MAG: glycyl radical protein, partial [Lachnospiraceae bacterium]|nr:glycyl radical protein [Lachnospiraceae bacterium]